MMSYGNMLQSSQGIYNQVVQGYQGVLAQQQAAEANVAAGYGSLSHSVLGTIAGVGKAQKQAIADAYQQQSGQAQQSLINSGLGNTTVTSSVNRGLFYDKQKANVALADQIAQLKAGYMSQIGMAGLGYRGQAVQADTGVGLASLGFQGGYAQQMLGLGAQQQRGGYGMGGGGTAVPMSGGSGGSGFNPNPQYQDPMLGLSALQNQAYGQMYQPQKYTDPYMQTKDPPIFGGAQQVPLGTMNWGMGEPGSGQAWGGAGGAVMGAAYDLGGY